MTNAKTSAADLKKMMDDSTVPVAVTTGADFPGKALADSHAEMLEILQRVYDRTGDLSIKPVIERAKAAK